MQAAPRGVDDVHCGVAHRETPGGDAAAAKTEASFSPARFQVTDQPRCRAAADEVDVVGRSRERGVANKPSHQPDIDPGTLCGFTELPGQRVTGNAMDQRPREPFHEGGAWAGPTLPLPVSAAVGGGTLNVDSPSAPAIAPCTVASNPR